MLCSLYTLKSEYRNRKIYIWDVNRDSMIIFTRLALCRINIEGFVADDKVFVGDKYMNRPILSIEQVDNTDSIILVYDDEKPKDISKFKNINNIVYWSLALELDANLRNRKIIMYGTGRGAMTMCEAFAENGIEEELFCVTKSEKKSEFKGKKVIEVSNLNQYIGYTVVVSVISQLNADQIIDILYEYGFKGDVYLDFKFLYHVVESSISFPQCLNKAILENKKVYLYGVKNYISDLITDICNIYNIDIAGYVYEVGNHDEGIQSIYNLAYEGIEDKFIIISKITDFIKSRTNIELAGFSLTDMNYTSIRAYTEADQEYSQFKYIFDTLVGTSIPYTKGYIGWKQYGRVQDGNIRIIVLGGSTSSESYHPENWVSKLYYRLLSENINTTIYNGAHCGNDIVHEILRVMRDANVIKPHIVISMSGVNNIVYKYDVDNLFNVNHFVTIAKNQAYKGEYCSGIKNDETLYSFWNRNEKILKVISEFYGAKFFGFLQPNNLMMNKKNLYEKSFFEKELNSEGSFSKYANNEEIYINIKDIFEHQDSMYLDHCHYTDKAHEIIADKVYKAIIPTIKAMINKC